MINRSESRLIAIERRNLLLKQAKRRQTAHRMDQRARDGLDGDPRVKRVG